MGFIHRFIMSFGYDSEVVASVLESASQLGTIRQGYDKHFYSNGAFNLVQLMLYVLRPTRFCALTSILCSSTMSSASAKAVKSHH